MKEKLLRYKTQYRCKYLEIIAVIQE